MLLAIVISLEINVLSFPHFLGNLFDVQYGTMPVYAVHLGTIFIAWLFLKKTDKWSGVKKGLLLGLYSGVVLTLLSGFSYLLFIIVDSSNSQRLIGGMELWGLMLSILYGGVVFIIGGGIIGVVVSLINKTLKRR